MRVSTILAAGTALAFSLAANAQAPSGQPSPSKPPAAAPQTPAIQSVNVVDISELPEATQTQVNQVVAQRGDGELQKLRTAIDAAPVIKSALEAKGLTSEHVLIAQMSEGGQLTLVTKRAG